MTAARAESKVEERERVNEKGKRGRKLATSIEQAEKEKERGP